VIRLSASERYDADGNLTPAGKETFTRENLAAIVALFRPGDVVFDEERPDVLGIVEEASGRGMSIVWEHGGSSGGGGLVPSTWHHEPRVNVPVPKGALGHRWWNRQQAVKAALRRAGLR